MKRLNYCLLIVIFLLTAPTSRAYDWHSIWGGWKTQDQAPQPSPTPQVDSSNPFAGNAYMSIYAFSFHLSNEGTYSWAEHNVASMQNFSREAIEETGGCIFHPVIMFNSSSECDFSSLVIQKDLGYTYSVDTKKSLISLHNSDHNQVFYYSINGNFLVLREGLAGQELKFVKLAFPLFFKDNSNGFSNLERSRTEAWQCYANGGYGISYIGQDRDIYLKKMQKITPDEIFWIRDYVKSLDNNANTDFPTPTPTPTPYPTPAHGPDTVEYIGSYTITGTNYPLTVVMENFQNGANGNISFTGYEFYGVSHVPNSHLSGNYIPTSETITYTNGDESSQYVNTGTINASKFTGTCISTEKDTNGTVSSRNDTFETVHSSGPDIHDIATRLGVTATPQQLTNTTVIPEATPVFENLPVTSTRTPVPAPTPTKTVIPSTNTDSVNWNFNGTIVNSETGNQSKVSLNIKSSPDGNPPHSHIPIHGTLTMSNGKTDDGYNGFLDNSSQPVSFTMGWNNAAGTMEMSGKVIENSLIATWRIKTKPQGKLVSGTIDATK